MSCGGRVYRGDTITISVPFEVDDYSNLTITYSTLGDNVVTKTQDEVTIEDGFITYTFEDGELDLLPDGVIYYTIACDVDGVPNVDSTNTNIYLKTPAGYSGKTAEDYYQEGYEAGLEDCSGGTPCDCTEEKEQAFQSGYTAGAASCSGDTPCDCESAVTQAYQEGYAAGIESCPDCPSGSSCNLETRQFPLNEGFTPTLVEPSEGYDGISSVYVYDNGYGQQRYDNGYAAGQAACSGDTPDCTSAVTEAYQSGITYQKSLLTTTAITANGVYERPDGYYRVDVNVDGAPQLQVMSYNLDEYWSGESGDVYPDASLGFGGFRYFMVNDIGYGQAKYNQGYAAGQAACSGTPCDCTEEKEQAFQSGYTAGYTSGSSVRCELYSVLYVTTSADSAHLTIIPDPQFGNGFSVANVNMDGFGQKMYNEGYQSGVTDGSASACSEAIEIAYQSGYSAGLSDCPECDCTEQVDNAHYSGYNEGKNSVIKSLLSENDSNYVIAYYYTSARTMCLITGAYSSSTEYFDGNACVSAMSINGGAWQPAEKYLELAAGWTQIRFDVCNNSLSGMFAHRFTPSRECDMDALKVVSIPSKITGLTNTYTFHMNDGLRVLASSCGLMRNTTNQADNVNVVICHYAGAQREYTYFPSSGVFFIPAGSSADWTSVLSNWTHIEMCQ